MVNYQECLDMLVKCAKGDKRYRDEWRSALQYLIKWFENGCDCLSEGDF